MKYTIIHMVRVGSLNLYMPHFEQIEVESKKDLKPFLREKEWDVQMVLEGHPKRVENW